MSELIMAYQICIVIQVVAVGMVTYGIGRLLYIVAMDLS